ncbi:hypothetical protein HWV00_17010 [Moritella sp. 24]|uniref:hypothetical protein n=1 Tax=Moritella sp. 24 TaxID=2746230 RepID=UPI001BA8073E|nr:hypothetical protein [Moritella sp. 24]QUM77784.1 hypothetical protein HWV00_17010 [Moritella sp. 24]
MFKKLILITFVLFTPSAFANDWSFGEIFSTVDALATNVTTFFFDDVPNLIDRAMAYFFELLIYAQIKTTIYAMQTGFTVAKLIVSDFGIVQMVETFAGQLPADIRHAAVKMNIFNAFNLIVEAYIARFVISYL